jgi:hypothetical protein
VNVNPRVGELSMSALRGGFPGRLDAGIFGVPRPLLATVNLLHHTLSFSGLHCTSLRLRSLSLCSAHIVELFIVMLTLGYYESILTPRHTRVSYFDLHYYTTI